MLRNLDTARIGTICFAKYMSVELCFHAFAIGIKINHSRKEVLKKKKGKEMLAEPTGRSR